MLWIQNLLEVNSSPSDKLQEVLDQAHAQNLQLNSPKRPCTHKELITQLNPEIVNV